MHAFKDWEGTGGFWQDLIKAAGSWEGQVISNTLTVLGGLGNAVTGLAITEAIKLHVATCKGDFMSDVSMSSYQSSYNYETIFNCIMPNQARKLKGNECQASCIESLLDPSITPECTTATETGCCCHPKIPELSNMDHATCTTTSFSEIPYCSSVGAWGSNFGCCLVQFGGSCSAGRAIGVWTHGNTVYQKCIGGSVPPVPSCTSVGFKSCGVIQAITGSYPIMPINLCVKPNSDWQTGESYNDYCPFIQE